MKISTEVRYGVYLGLTMCFYTIFMWLTKLDTTYLSIGRYLNVAIIIAPLSITFLAIWAKSKEIKLTLFNRISCGLVVNFIANLIYAPFLQFYHHIINPDWLKYVLELKEKELLAINASAEQIQAALENLRIMSSSEFNLITNSLIVGVIGFGIVFSMMTLPFFRRKTGEIA